MRWLLGGSVAVALALALGTGACADPGFELRCVPGARLACFCAAGGAGVQSCGADRELGDCRCQPGGDGGPADGSIDASDGGDGPVDGRPGDPAVSDALPDTSADATADGTPACQALLAAVNGERGRVRVIPFAQLELLADRSTGSNGDREGLLYEFRVESAPGPALAPGGSAALFNAGLATCEGHAGQGPLDPRRCLEVSYAGDYLIRLTVSDPQGCVASDELRVEVRPERPLYVELLVEGGGVEPHLTPPGGRFETGPADAACVGVGGRDCWRCTCGSFDQDGDRVPDLSGLDWGSEPGLGDGDPDNNPALLFGRRCEPTFVSRPQVLLVGSPGHLPGDGAYHLGLGRIDECGAPAPLQVTVRLHVLGELVDEQTAQLPPGLGFWHGARIDWEGGSARLCALDRLLALESQDVPAHPDDDLAPCAP